MTTGLLFRGFVTGLACLGLAPLFGDTLNPGATPCSSSFSLSSLVGSGIGCTLGGEFTVSEFSFTASAGAPLIASDITVTPTVTAVGGIIVLIDLSFTATGGFTNVTANPLQYTFDYILDPQLPVTKGASISLDPGGTLTEDICAGGLFSGSVCNPGTAFFTVLTATSLLPTESTAFPNGVNTVDYQLVLDLPVHTVNPDGQLNE